MSIPGQQVINIGLPNEPTNSDSLYTAFTKANVNFTTLFNSASPYNTFTASTGIGVTANANTGTVIITNTGVTQLNAGTGITLSGSNGNITIASNGGGNGGGGTVTSVGLAPISATRLTVTGSPIVSSGVMNIDLATSGVTAGTYSNPNVTVDAYGRVTAVANGTIAGTVTSVGLVPGSGIQVSGGPITSNGNITVTNTGVTRLNAGAGILLSSGNGNVTISANTSSGTVTAVGVTSSQLVVTGSPVVSSGTIAVNLPNSATFSGNITAGGVKTDNLYYANGTPWDLQLPGGSNTQVQFNDADQFGGNSGFTFNKTTGIFTAPFLAGNGNGLSNIQGANVSGAVSSATTAGTVTTAAQPNITSTGTLANLSVTGNTTVGNLIIPSGNIIYTPRYGSFYSNVTQTNPVANTAMAMTFNNSYSANGVSITSSSRLTVAKAGIYNIQFSAQCSKTDAGTDYLEIWLSKNGSSVPWTNTRIKLDGSNAYEVASWNFVETLGASEYVQVMWGSADLNAQIVAIPSANTTMGIDVPSVIVTVTPVGA